MDSNKRIISNLQDVVGCNGLRSLKDLGLMRLDTIRGRVSDVEKKLPIQSIISIFIAWLQAKAMQVGLKGLPLDEWCRQLSCAYGCTEPDVLWYWDSSERVVWDHVSTYPGKLSEVRRRMGDVCRAIRQVFARQNDAPVPVHVREESQRQRQTSCGPSGGALRGDGHEGDRRDISPGRAADKTDGNASRASSAKNVNLNTNLSPRGGTNSDGATSRCPADDESSEDPVPPNRYICNICGTWGTHYVWNCKEQIRHRHQTTVDVEKLPVDGGIVNDRKIQETRETQSTPVKPERNDHCSTETSKSDPLVAPRDKIQKQDIQDDVSPQKPGLETGLALRPSSAPRESWPSNNSNSDDFVKSSVSREVGSVNSPGKMHALDAARMSSQEEVKRSEYQVNVREVAKDMKELSAADEVALQCADDFLCRLEYALKKKYRSEVEGDLMIWDDKLSRKRPRVETANGHGGLAAVGQVSFFDTDADADADAAYIPCPASATTRSESRESDASHSERMLSGIFRNRTADERHAQKPLPGLTWIPTVQEPRHSAIELWQAGIEFRAGETSEEDG